MERNDKIATFNPKKTKYISENGADFYFTNLIFLYTIKNPHGNICT